MKALSRSMLAIGLLVSFATGIATADNAKPDAAAAGKATAGKATGIKATGTLGTVGTGSGGTVNLNSSDCKLLLGGQVVYVTDGRCGASGAYCKSSSGSACLTER